MKKKVWVIGYAVIVVILLVYIAVRVISVDPFFHYHAPDLQNYFYRLNNERSQNYGIVKNFDYQGIITGTSMTENFKTSEADQLFGVRFVKTSFSGSSYYELSQLLMTALSPEPVTEYVTPPDVRLSLTTLLFASSSNT